MIAELEARLQASWDDETAAVYADALIAAGDPRGELIAIDLHVARHGGTPELAARRTAKLVEWLGERLAGWLRPAPLGLVHAGIYPLQGQELDRLLASPASRFLRSLTLYLEHLEVPSTFAALARTSHPWLRQLTLTVRDNTNPIPRATFERFAAATPHLEQITLDGEALIATPGHPRVHTLALTGGAPIVVGSESMPAVTELSLQFSPGKPMRPAIANPRLFPALRRIDLTRSQGTVAEVLVPFLARLEGLDRIDHVILRTLYADADLVAIRGLVAHHPGLEVTIQGMYQGVFAAAAEPRLHIPPARPWRSPETVHGREAISVEPGHDLALKSILEELEVAYDAMPAETQAAWRAVLEAFEALPEEDAADPIRAFDRATLVRALRALPYDARCAATLTRIEAAPVAETVELSRYWGW